MVYYSVSGYNEDMFLVGILSWWYSLGWRARAVAIEHRLGRTADYFSISILTKTLFAPYRQISAGRVGGSMSQQLRAFGDQLVSRIIGFIMRTIMIIAGVIALAIQLVWGGTALIVWPLVPAFPVVGVLLWVIGWVPTWA